MSVTSVTSVAPVASVASVGGGVCSVSSVSVVSVAVADWVFVGSGTVLGAVVSEGWITVASVTAVATDGSVVLLCSVAGVGLLVPAVSEGIVCAADGVVSSDAGGVVAVGVVLYVLLVRGALYFTGLTESVICSPVKIYNSLFSPVCI